MIKVHNIKLKEIFFWNESWSCCDQRRLAVHCKYDPNKQNKIPIDWEGKEGKLHQGSPRNIRIK